MTGSRRKFFDFPRNLEGFFRKPDSGELLSEVDASEFSTEEDDEWAADSLGQQEECVVVTPTPADIPTVGDPGSQLSFVSQLATAYPGRSDTVIDGGLCGNLDVRAASIRGKSHRDNRESAFSITRQDEYCVQLTRDEKWLVVFVCDGVSSGELSHMAASIAARMGCKIVCRSLEENSLPSELPWKDIGEQIAGGIVTNWLKATPEDAEVWSLLSAEKASFDAEHLASLDIETARSVRRMSARDCATTAIAAVISTGQAEEVNETSCTVVTLAGDSSGWILDPDEGWRSLSAIKNEGAEFASNVTSGLPIVGDVSVQSLSLAPGQALFLMTDGLGDPLGSGKGEVGAYLATEWRTPPSVYQFAATLDFHRRTFDDDRTSVGVWLQSESETADA